MKTAVVAIRDLEQGPKGKVIYSYEGSANQARFGGVLGRTEDTRHVEIPDEWDLRAVLVTIYNERWIKMNEEGEITEETFTNPEDESFIKEDGIWALAIESEEVKRQIMTADSLANIKRAVSAAIAFGNQMILDFATENVILGITQDGQTGVVLERMAPVITALQTGSLYEAILKAKAIPEEQKDAKYITNARLLEFVNKIETYLGLPLSAALS